MKIRDALKSDLSSMAELLLVVQQLHAQAQPKIYREISPGVAVDFLAQRMSEEKTYLRVAEVGSELQGYSSASVRTGPSMPLLRAREILYVNEVIVRPSSRRSGIGSALMADLKDLAWQNGLEDIELDVGHFNSEAKAFFQHQGFAVLRERMSMCVGTD